MTVSEFLTECWQAYRGKDDTKTPAFGTDKADMVLLLANRFIRTYARDTKVHRSSLFDIKDVDTIDITDLSYDLDDDFISPSGNFIVTTTEDDDVEITLAKPEKRDTAMAYISGFDPRKVTFADDIEDRLDGGTLKAPGYYMPTALANSTDVIPVDDPNWLVYRVAAELARNDTSKEDQFPSLMGIANDYYQNMAISDDDLGEGQNNTVPYDVQPIDGYADNSASI